MYSLKVEKQFMLEAGVKEELFSFPKVIEVFERLDTPTGIDPWTGRTDTIGSKYGWETTPDGGLILKKFFTRNWCNPMDYPGDIDGGYTESYEHIITISPNGEVKERERCLG